MITDDIKNVWRNLTRIKLNYTHNFLDIQLKDRKLKELKESYLYTLIPKDRPLLISSSNFPISQLRLLDSNNSVVTTSRVSIYFPLPVFHFHSQFPYSPLCHRSVLYPRSQSRFPLFPSLSAEPLCAATPPQSLPTRPCTLVNVKISVTSLFRLSATLRFANEQAIFLFREVG